MAKNGHRLPIPITKPVTKQDVLRMIDRNARGLGVSTEEALERVRQGHLGEDTRWADISMLDAMMRAK